MKFCVSAVVPFCFRDARSHDGRKDTKRFAPAEVQFLTLIVVDFCVTSHTLYNPYVAL
jgi:hypothetical protein